MKECLLRDVEGGRRESKREEVGLAYKCFSKEVGSQIVERCCQF